MIPALTALLLGLLLGYRWGRRDEKDAAFRVLDRVTDKMDPLDRIANERGLW